MIAVDSSVLIDLLGNGSRTAAAADALREAWNAFMANGFIRFITFLFIVSLCYHAWVGVRDIWMDYVKPATIRVTLHVLTLLALVGYAGWAVQIIWRLP